MKKQTKLWMVPCAQQHLPWAWSMMFFCSNRWQEDGGTWRYYVNGGSLVTDAWKKSGNRPCSISWIPIGEMAKSQVNRL